MTDQIQLAGYARCETIFLDTTWHFEVENEELKVAVLIAETLDGSVYFGMNRLAAERLQQMLRLFLKNFDARPS